ncbi:MAG: hypothetical protein K6G03_06215 [Lachnospiraceae bacterium]|nr:hypothetical protein [Lachnospiraceae bacterium]
MSIRIGSNLSSLYNSTYVSPTQDIDKASKVDQAQNIASGQQNSSGNQYIAQDHGGVVQTRVSDDNAFHKTQLEGSRERIEDMAGKLFKKLPDILKDMQNLPEESGEQAASRVAVTERNAAVIADRQAAGVMHTGELQDFSL